MLKIKNLQIKRVEVSIVDNSLEISNISLTPKDLMDTHHLMTLISKSRTNMILISPPPIIQRCSQEFLNSPSSLHRNHTQSNP